MKKMMLSISLLLGATASLNAMDQQYMYWLQKQQIPAHIAQELESFDPNEAWEAADLQTELMNAIYDNSLTDVISALEDGAQIDTIIEQTVLQKESLTLTIVIVLAFHRSCSWNFKRDLKIAFPAIAKLSC